MFAPGTRIHPGVWLKVEVIETRGLSVTVAAERLGVTRQAISNLLNGNAGLSADMALRFEKTFQIDANELLRMQAAYDLAAARGDDGDPTTEISKGGIEYVAAEALSVFDEIAGEARQSLQHHRSPSPDNVVSSGALTAVRVAERLSQIGREIMDGHALLAREPAIARVVAADENDQKHVFYISRAAPNGRTTSRYRFASYRAPMGRLASLPPGGFIELPVDGKPKSFEVIDRALFRPEELDDGWDSHNTVFEGDGARTITVASLRRLLDDTRQPVDTLDEIDRVLAAAEADQNIISGRTRGIITKMQLRDQAVLDAYQDEIFRLPLDSQLVILGPPGTGKTTTLIRRLGQKLDRHGLSEEEVNLIENADLPLPHFQSWIMFTPTDLLRQYLKEAFAREGVPAPDQRIKTWENFQKELARNHLGILRTASGGGPFVMKESTDTITDAAARDPIGWYEAFHRGQLDQFWSELLLAADALAANSDENIARLGRRLADALRDGRSGPAAPLIYALVGMSGEVRRIRTGIKSEIERQLKQALARAQTDARLKGDDFFSSLMSFIDSLGEPVEGSEEDGEAEDEEEDEDERPTTKPAAAQRAFFAALRLQARRTRRGRRKTAGRTASILDWIGDRGLEREEARELAQRLTLQLALNRFAAPVRRYLLKIPARYQRFRRLERGGHWYTPTAPGRDAHPLEIDVVILSMLRSAAELLGDGRIRRRLHEPAYDSANAFRNIQRNQIIVDEAPDFSPVQLACMRALAGKPIDSFFACGDFNQRVTEWGTRNEESLKWVESGFDVRRVAISYRQSRQLHEFAHELLTLKGDHSAGAELPDDVNNEAVDPVLAIHLSGHDAVADWLSTRLIEIEKAISPNPLPSTAVLVHSEDEVRPVTDALNRALEDQNLRAVACVDGQIIGRDDEIRVFDVRHIKGLEFEAVFFIGIDKLAELEPQLFDRYLYVGATRAATYLGISCEIDLPRDLKPLETRFALRW